MGAATVHQPFYNLLQLLGRSFLPLLLLLFLWAFARLAPTQLLRSSICRSSSIFVIGVGRCQAQPHRTSRRPTHQHLPNIDGSIVDVVVFTLFSFRGVEPLVRSQALIFPHSAGPCHFQFYRRSLLHCGLFRNPHGSQFHLLFGVTFLLSSCLWVHVQQIEGVVQDLGFDKTIQLGFGGEGRGVIHLQQPGLQFVVEHDIEPQNFKAHGVLDVFRLTTVVEVRQARLNCDEGLDNQVLDLAEQGVDIVTFFPKVVLNSLPASLVPI
mmetsp:Transcript_53503/g.117155  ORF Transcript_53503/g.117155 Transcript_53503/m.117155 type:complete len:266 (-) Transcript_53503:845-1642(-)